MAETQGSDQHACSACDEDLYDSPDHRLCSPTPCCSHEPGNHEQGNKSPSATGPRVPPSTAEPAASISSASALAGGPPGKANEAPLAQAAAPEEEEVASPWAGGPVWEATKPLSLQGFLQYEGKERSLGSRSPAITDGQAGDSPRPQPACGTAGNQNCKLAARAVRGCFGSCPVRERRSDLCSLRQHLSCRATSELSNPGPKATAHHLSAQQCPKIGRRVSTLPHAALQLLPRTWKAK